ncbi:uncharacterized protein LOC108683407 [Hyalella azteca]|uniref:Uncharacterized protein LOC108683407 n=1 Tax=Hyalella azteca TaxID=294128 RepID=A0A8B7PPS5_HYAAZ|nr:uncharacterized protein LOC108683407 [Hyalella azteca]
MKCPEAENLLNGPPGSSNVDFSLNVDIRRIGYKTCNALSSNNKAVKNLTSSRSSRPRQPQIPNSNGSGTFIMLSKKDFQNISYPPYVCLKNYQQTALCDIRKKCLAQNSRQNRRFVLKEIHTEFRNECQDGVKICLRPAFEQSDRYDSVEKRPLAVLRSEKRRQMKSSAWKQQNNWTAPLSRLLSMFFLLTGAVSVEQISRTLTSENHFLETELPVLNVFGIEGGEAKIPCDLTPPRPHDTPNLILISRGATPLYSVDARGGAASSSIHWVNREVLGDRVQFLLPTNFPLLGHSLSQYPVKYNSKIPIFPASSPVYNSNFSNYQSVPLSSEYSYQNSLQRFSTGDDSVERDLYNIRLQRGKAAKVARHAEHNSKYNTNSLAKNNVALKEYDQWPQTVRSFQDLQSTNMEYSQKENKSNIKMRSLAFLQNPKNRTGFEERLTSTVSFHSNKWQEADHVSDASSKSSYVKESSLQNQLLALSREDLLPEKTPEKIKSDPSKKNYSTRSKDVLDEKFQSSHSTASKDESLSPLFDHSNSTLEIPEVYREVVVPESNIHWSHSHLKLNYWRDILDDTGFKSRLNGRTIRSSQAARDAEDPSEKPPDTAYGILVIRQLLRTDGGKFHCRVDFRQAPTMLSQAKLTVIVPPSSLDIRGVNGLRVTGRVGPYAVGDVLNLWCSAAGGNPQPSVSWWFDGELLDDLSEDQRDDVTTNNLTVTGLSRHHLGKSLTCRASNTNLTKPLQASVTIDMKLPPVSVRITGSQEGVREGRLHKLTCSSEGSNPPAVLTWWARTQQLTHLTYQESPDSTSSTSILHLQPSAADDGLRVSCRATNALLGPAFALEDSVRITVLYSPRVSLRLSPLLNISNINENDDVFLDCDVMANPAVTLLKWHHNCRQALRGNKEENIVAAVHNICIFVFLFTVVTPVCRGNSVAEENLASLELSPDAVDARGLISSAKDNTNSIRSDTSDSSDTDAIDLDASDGDTAAPKIYGTGVGVAVNITCSVDAHPKPHTFTWSLNATSQEQSQPADDSLRRHHQTRAPNRSRTSTASYGSSSNLLTYTPHTSHEFGTLLCWAQNDVGRQADPCVFQTKSASLFPRTLISGII